MADETARNESMVTRLAEAIRRRWLLLAIFGLITPAAAAAYSTTRPNKYTATASLLFRDPELDSKLFGSAPIAQTGDETRQAATNLTLVSLRSVSERTARAIDSGLNAEDVRRRIQVTQEGQSDVVGVAATDLSPKRAKELANTFATEFIAFRREADQAKVAEAQRLVASTLNRLSPPQRRGTQGRSLENRNDQLRLLRSLQTGNAELVQPAGVPTSPSSPRPVRDGILGLLLGLILGASSAWLAERLDRRMRSFEEFERAFERPILGAVPESRSLLADAEGGPGAAETEAFRLVRANLRYFKVDRDIRSVLVTSAAPGEGKTTVAWNLALATAEAGGRVILLEADLRQPKLVRHIGSDIAGGVGLSTVLAGETPLDDAIRHIPVDSTNGHNGRTVSVVPAGPTPPNPTDLLESERMQHLIAELEESYDMVILDTAPTSIVSDAVPLIPHVSGVIVVARLGVSRRDSVQRLRSQLDHLHAAVLGVVVNGVTSAAAYGGAYGYYLAPTQSGRYEGSDGLLQRLVSRR